MHETSQSTYNRISIRFHTELLESYKPSLYQYQLSIQIQTTLLKETSFTLADIRDN